MLLGAGDDLLGGDVAALGTEHNGLRAGRDDAGFLGGNAGELGSEDSGVLIRESGDDGGGLFGEDVGAVEASAKANLYDLGIDVRIAEGEERHSGEELEGAEATRGVAKFIIDDGLELGDERSETVLGDRFAVDRNPLGEFVEVGASVEAGAEMGCPKDRFDHGGDGAFALGAGDVDGEAGGLGAAEANEKGGDAVEGEGRALAIGLARSLEVSESEEVVDGGAVVHGAPH